RTALDVVANRLDHLGLGSLCAVVHDPQRDQRDLYRAVRERVENLAETKIGRNPDRKLERLDTELEEIHAELTRAWQLLQQADADSGASLHDLVGQWLNIEPPPDLALDPHLLADVRWPQFERHERAIQEALSRGRKVEYAQNPWTAAAGISLADLLAQPADDVRRTLQACLTAARQADDTLQANVPRFSVTPPRGEQAAARAELARRWETLLAKADCRSLERWSRQDATSLRRARDQLRQVESFWETFRGGPLDVELAAGLRAQPPSLATLSEQSSQLGHWQQAAATWHGFLHFSTKRQATAVLRPLGLPTTQEAATRAQRFFQAVRARLILGSLLAELSGDPPAVSLASDDQIERGYTTLADVLDLLLELQTDDRLASARDAVLAAFADQTSAAGVVAGLQQSAARAGALDALADRLLASHLFAAASLQAMLAAGDRGAALVTTLESLAEKLDTLEGVLRVRQAVEALPNELRPAVQSLLDRSSDPQAAAEALHKGALSAEISARILTSPELQLLDDERMRSQFERYNALDREKKELVRDSILYRWVSRQQQRLLVATGSRLNGLGADLRRRLTMRGERALRLRQVISVGQSIEDGDPLFDLCPVWLASPETVGQVFPRLAMFDVVIFDEASQCKLEEALPVLTRARRVVIAGDPQQLPPSRFFESAVAVSEQDEIATDQQLFEQHQGEIEDLLCAALGLDIQQCYLDVHYRSRTADLIEFSNQQFYSSRLQPIPGHPSHRLRFAPITLYHANGIYEDRSNAAEAERVCAIVRDLLRRAEPPSIGIACFNLQQRDLIAEKLDELADSDREFAARLAESRTRQGAGSFEGLFIKNLENVQGDERDHIIISTTYGPDAKGSFYRRFGPLGRAGGGRRLNVLVTRARAEVHLVTSIPPAVYRHLPPVPPGQAPGGGWLLFSYLAYAEYLAEIYEAVHQTPAEADDGDAQDQPQSATAQVWPSKSPSRFAQALAAELAERHGVGSQVHWGNDGFCVDLALAHPDRPDDVTIGILCDTSRFPQAEDPVEWDVFRTAILSATGWQLHRVWTPRFFRDPSGNIQAILQSHEA
ncbi:MAG: AAA domain-containing protein, partial [Pirellulales bacterium]